MPRPRPWVLVPPLALLAACGAGGSGKGTVAASGTRTVTGAFQRTYWPDTGDISTSLVPQRSDMTVSALVPTGDGYVTLPGTVHLDGTFEIPDVPFGTYFLQLPSVFVGPALTERSSSSVSLTDVTSSRPDLAHVTRSTPIDLTVSNMDPWQDMGGATIGDQFEIVSSQADVWRRPMTEPTATPPAPGDRSYHATVDWNEGWTGWTPGLPEASKGDVVYFYQADRFTVGSGNSLAYYRTPTKYNATSALTVADGAPSSISVDLVPVPRQGTLAVNFKGTLYGAIAADVNPSATTLYPPGIVIFAVPHTTGYPAPANSANARYLYLQTSATAADVDYGLIAYGQFLDPTFVEQIHLGQDFAVPVSAPGGASPTTIWATLSEDFPNEPSSYAGVFAPVLGPVRAPLVNGRDAFATLADTGTQPTISWSAPSLGAPTSYGVRLDEVASDGAGWTVTRFVLSVTLFSGLSFKVPGGFLGAGRTYVATITARQAPWDHLDVDGLASGYPLYSTDCVTGTFTTSAPETFSIEGRVYDPKMLPVPGVTVALSGATSATTTTDVQGTFSFDGLAPGNYTVTPLPGGGFSPSLQYVAVNAANVIMLPFWAP